MFGLLKRNGKIYVVMIPDSKSQTLIPIIREKVRPDSIIYTDAYKSYEVLVFSEFKYYRINHSQRFADKIESHKRDREFLEPSEAPSEAI